MSQMGSFGFVVALSLALVISNVFMMVLMGKGSEVHKGITKVLDACGCQDPRLRQQAARLFCSSNEFSQLTNASLRGTPTFPGPTFAGRQCGAPPQGNHVWGQLSRERFYGQTDMVAPWAKATPYYEQMTCGPTTPVSKPQRAFVEEVTPEPLVADAPCSGVNEAPHPPQTQPGKMTGMSALGRTVNYVTFNN